MKTLLGLGVIFGALVAAVGACSTSTTMVDAGPAPVVTDTSVPDVRTPTQADSEPDSARPDAADAADAAIEWARPGEPFDPLAPKPGDACPVGVPVNDVVTRRCGKCGNQTAPCEIGRVLGAYGPCTGEKPNAAACLPRERVVGACGNCGTRRRECDLTCAYVDGVCEGVVAGGCPANEVKLLEGVCPDPEHVRRQVCSAACVLGALEPCAAPPQPAPDHTVTVGAVGVGVTQVFTFDLARMLPLPQQPGFVDPWPCPLVLSTRLRPYRYVRVENPGAAPVTVTIETTGPVDTMLAYYLGDAPAPTVAARTACTGQVSDTASGLNGQLNGVSIPAAGAITAYIGEYFPNGTTSTFRVTVTN